MKVVVPVTVRFKLAAPFIAPPLLKVVTPVIVVVSGSVMMPELLLLKVVIVKIPRDESLAPEIVPSFVSVEILEIVEVVGSEKVAPALLVKVYGLKVKVVPDAKFMAPEFVTFKAYEEEA